MVGEQVKTEFIALIVATVFYLIIGGMFLWSNRHRIMCLFSDHEWENIEIRQKDTFYIVGHRCKRCDKLKAK